MPLVLFAPDVPVPHSPAARFWVLGMCRALRDAGHDVLLHPRHEDLGGLSAALNELGVQVLPHDPVEPEHMDAHGHLPRFRARRVVIHARVRKVDLVVAQGTELALTIAGGRALQERLVSIPVDDPHMSGSLSPVVARRFESFIEGSRRVLVVSDAQRADLEAQFPASAARIGVLPTPSEVDVELSVPSHPIPGTADIEVCLDFFPNHTVPDLAAYADASRALRHPPRVRLTGGEPLQDASPWREIPGIVLSVGTEPTAAPWGLVPPPRDHVAHSLAVAYHLARGARPALVARVRPAGLDPRVAVLASTAELVNAAIRPTPQESSGPVFGSVTALSPWSLSARSISLSQADDGAPLRLLFVGQDLSALAPAIRVLAERPDVEARAMRIAEPEPDAPRTPLPDGVGDAQVVVVSSAGPLLEAVARGMRPDQRLVVHVPDGLEDVNVPEDTWSRCDAVVADSPQARARFIGGVHLPAERLHVVPPALDPAGLGRGKTADARLHLRLSMDGLAPADVRVALRLLRQLRETDPRHVLHLQGPFPWEGTGGLATAAADDMWRQLVADIGRDDVLLGGLSVDVAKRPHAECLRRVGWLLVPRGTPATDRVVLAALAAGTVPLPLSDEAEETFELVRAAVNDPHAFEARAAAAQRAALPYDPDTVADAWAAVLAVVPHLPDSPPPAGPDPLVAPATDDDVLAVVEEALREGSYERALGLLDAAVGITSRSKGPVKDAELWVRGIAALDARRLTHYLPRTDATFRTSLPPLLVRSTGDTAGPEFLHTLDLTPYPFRDPRDDAPAGVPAETIPGEGAEGGDSSTRSGASPSPHGPVSTVGRLIRADRWLEAHAGVVANHVQHLGLDHIVARGPWWVAFPAALAADRLRLPATWIVTQPEDIRRAERALAAPYSSDVLEHTVLRTFEGMCAVVDETGLLEHGALKTHMPVVEQPLPAPPTVLGEGRPAPTPDYGGIPMAVERDLSDLTLLVLGPAEFVESWSRAGVRVVAPGPLELPVAVGADIDLVVVDAEAGSDEQWAPLLSAPSPRERSRLAVLFDSARNVGASSLVVGHRLPAWPAEILPTVRKADLLTVATLAQAEPVLQLNPLAVVRVVPCVADRPWEGAPERFLRALGLGIRNGKRTATEGSVEEAGGLAPGISLILATHRGAERISGMLESIAVQTIPAHLVEVVVIENGGAPESREIVDQFASRTGLNVIYRFREEPGVGGARNLGLQLASHSHVTFVDDDDLLGRDFLLAAWMASSSTTVVLSRLHDLSTTGEVLTQTPQAKNVDSLQGARQSLELRPWALGQNACKLIPTAVARECRYPEGLHSGEDVVFMAQLMGRGLSFVPAAELADPAYLRVRRENSVSRRALTFDFAVRERLAVMAALEQVDELLNSSEEHQAISALSGAQAGFVLRYRTEHPEEVDAVDAAILTAGMRYRFAHLGPVETSR